MKKRILSITFLLILVPTILIIFMNYQAKFLDSLKSYIRAEGLYAKGQKNAVYHLKEYSLTRNQKNYETFLEEIKIPLGDKIAREALNLNPPNIQKAYEGFLQGKNHPEDIEGLIWLYLNFKNSSYFIGAVKIWVTADQLNEELKKLGERIYQNQKYDINELNFLNSALEKQEINFSLTLSESAREMKRLLELLGYAMFVTLVLFSILSVRRIFQDLNKSQNQLIEYKYNLENLVKVKTKEIVTTKNRFETLVNDLGDKYIVFSYSLDGEIIFISKGSTSLFGLNPEEVIGKKWFDLIEWDSDSIKKGLKNVRKLIANESNYEELDMKFTHTDGSERIIHTTTHITKDDNGNIISIDGVAEDITEKVKSDKIIIDAKETAELASKAKSSFLANMSHEIRTPMNAIIGMSHLALKTKLDDKQKNYISKINISANNLLGIINDILDISKIEAGKLEIDNSNFDLFQVIESVVNLVELKVIDKDIDITVEYDPNLGKEFFGDSLRINQIITNLLGNAVKFTQKGEIGLVVNKINDRRVRFEIKDTGIGITNEQLKKLFKSFSQADSSTSKQFGGTGLGLAISKQLVEMMNGQIWCESELGKGSKFIFEIELKKDYVEKPYTIFTGKKVLIVDDCQSWLDILGHLLKTFGIESEAVNSGEEALKILKENTDKYDLILVDWNMPKLDGIETCKKIENELKIDSKKIILVSAYSKESLEEGIKEAHIDNYLHKPVNPSSLNDILSELFLGKKQTELRKKSNESLEDDMKLLKNKNILLVEDNEVNQEIVLDILEEYDINIDIANNGIEGIQKYKEMKDKYDLILMDIQMPILDGYEASKEIRTFDKKIPIIALTANAMKEDIEKTYTVGMNEHLNKPIDFEKLFKTLIKYIPVNSNSFENKYVEFVNQDNNEIDVPNFKYLDTEYGLGLMMGSKKSYLNLVKGLLKYKDMDFNSFEDEELKRNAHSLKGLSAGAGAKDLSELSKKLEKTLDRTLIESLNKELLVICEDIEKKLK